MSSGAELTHVLLGFMRLIVWQMLFAAAVVAILLVADAPFREYIYSPDPVPEPNSYDGLLATLAQIAGIFLALYFTAIIGVASARYADVRGRVYAVLIRALQYNRYIKVVALFGAVSTLLLLLTSLGIDPGLPNLFLATFLALFSILGFVRLGFETLAFFDPTRLTGYVLADLGRHIEAVTPDAPEWPDPAYQTWHQREAEELLMTYADLVALASTADHLKGRNVLWLVSRILDLLAFYAAHKPSIPTESLWFRRAYRRQLWLTADEASVHLALSTGRGLDPRAVPDNSWFEDSVCRTVRDGLDGLVAGDPALASGLSETVYRTLESQSISWGVDGALRLHRALLPTVRKVIHRTDGSSASEEKDTHNVAISLEIARGYGATLAAIVIGLSKRCSSTTAESLAQALDDIRWERPGTAYEHALPRPAIEAVEFMQKTLAFELAVEGRVVTPRWYRRQYAARKVCDYLADSVVELVAELEQTFPKEVDALLSSQALVTADIPFAMELIRSGLEACEKYDHHMEIYARCWDEMLTLRIQGDGLWPAMDWQALNDRVARVRERLLGSLAVAVPHLGTMPRSDVWPDYLGEAFYRLGQACYDAMAAGKEELFSRLFPAYFRASLEATARWWEETDRYGDAMTRLMLKVEPITDLLEISGFAILYSELDGKCFRSIVTQKWDEHLDRIGDPSQFIALINSALWRRTVDVTIAPGDVRRTRWRQAFDRRARELPQRTGPYGTFAGYVHPSRLIRRVAWELVGMWVDASEVFVAAYLARHPKAAALEVPRRAKDLAEWLEREEPGEEQEDQWE